MSSNHQNLTASYYTLGCKLNFSETSAIGRALRGCGIMTAPEGTSPDIIVVNTCSVTETADKKGRSLIRHLSRQHPSASIIVTGCYAQVKPEEVSKLPGVALVLGSGEKLRAAEFLDRWLQDHSPKVAVTPSRDIENFLPSCERGDRTRWFLKIQDGCDYFCTYCTIPYARGRSRSGNIADLVSRAEQAAGEGAKEIVITGVNIGEFGNDNGQSFFELLKDLDKVHGVERFRISSIEPNLLTDDIIDWVADSRAFMPHFHIPLQSGSDHVLKMMNRRYDTDLFRERIKHIKRAMPHAFIGVDVIAGARGETEEEWLRAKAFIESLPITRLHVFPYSERPGTAALKLPDPVEPAIRHKRVSELIDISDRKLKDFLIEETGRETSVLWEHTNHDGKIQGFTDNYIRVHAPFDESLPNTVTPIVLTKENIVTAQ